MRKTKYAVELTEAERARLRTLIGSGTAPSRMLTHARILLKANQGEGGPGWTDVAIAGAVEVHPATVARVRRALDAAAAGRRAGAAGGGRGRLARDGTADLRANERKPWLKEQWCIP